MSFLDTRGFRLWFAVFVLFTGIAGDFWRDLLTWYGWGVIVALVVAGSVVLLVHNRHTVRLQKLPYPLIAFLGLAVISIAWSQYRIESVMGTAAQVITTLAAVAVAVTLSWPELLTVLGRVFKLVLGLSFLFEFVVAAIIRTPIYPVWVTPESNPAKLLYWSRDLLFQAGKIQGIVGNSSLLAMAALLGLIVFALQLATRTVRPVSGWIWLIVALALIAITQSATIFLALAAVVIVAAAVLLIRSSSSPRGRTARYGIIAVVVVVAVVVSVIERTAILHLLGKSSDFTGRSEIWSKVIALAQQHPAAGWGWISYWVPWVAPFDHLIVKGGVQVLHAHNAWLDVWLQLGILGLIVFGAFVLSTLVRSWLFSVDKVIDTRSGVGSYSWLTALPLLMFVAQLVQSLAESRMLVEGGWMLLVIWAVKTKWVPTIPPLAVQAKPGQVRTKTPA
ncbi:MAG: O-antigen ligase family protein [Actinomycetota bacterium]